MDSWCGSKAGQYYYSIYSKEQMDYIAKNGLNNIPRWEAIVRKAEFRRKCQFPKYTNVWTSV